MFDWCAIYERFEKEYDARNPTELARRLGVRKQSTHDWKTGIGHVPWLRMKRLVNEKGLSWDWLIDGKEPKFISYHQTNSKDFDWIGMNRRFLALYPNIPQNAIAKQLGVAQETVSKWKRVEKHVPWEKLQYATSNFGVRWDWLIEGQD